jgi:ribosomal protein L11 methylase PrmA
MFLLFSLLAFGIVWLVFFRYLFPVITGAPFLPTHDLLVEKMISALDFKGKTAVDIGCGDGRIVIALAKAGAQAYGYEINPILVWYAKRKIRKEKLEQRATVLWKSFWSVDMSRFDIVVVFGIPHIMRRLEEKLQKELVPGSLVVSNAFQFPQWVSVRKIPGGLYVYKKSANAL